MQRIKTVTMGAATGAALIALIHWASSWWVWLLAVAIWWFQARKLSGMVPRAIWAIAIWSLVVILMLNSNFLGQILVAAGFCLWQLGQGYYAESRQFKVAQAGWLEFMALVAAFSAETIWHWPVVIVLVVIYLASITIARNFFAGAERATRALAAAWGLIVTEASLVFSIWLVSYVLPHELLLIPQPAVVITALGYCFGSIYMAHASSKLSKARLAEYAIIGLCLVVIVIAGTRWNGTI